MSHLRTYVDWELFPNLRRGNLCYALIAVILTINAVGSTASAQGLDFAGETIAHCVAAMEEEPSIETRLLDLGWTEAQTTDANDRSLSGYRLSHFPEEMFGIAWVWRTEPARIGRNVISGEHLKQAWSNSNSFLSDLRDNSAASDTGEVLVILEHAASKSILVLEIERTSDMKRGKCSLAVTRDLVGASFDEILASADYPINYLQLSSMVSSPGRFRFLRGVSVKQDLFEKYIEEPFPFVAVYWTINEIAWKDIK